MATANTTSAPNFDIDEDNLQDEISKRLSQARGIADLLGNAKSELLDAGSSGDAAWIVKDLLREADRLVSILANKVRESEQVAS